MSFFVVDVESDGQIIGRHSMVCFGVVKLTPELDKTFYGQTKPILSEYVPSALAVSDFSREEHEKFPDPFITMDNFAKWLKEHIGWSSRRIGDLYCGMMKDTWASWKKLREAKHTHNPVDDAMGNAEALLKIKEMGLKIDTK